jgi:hypothetical protein
LGHVPCFNTSPGFHEQRFGSKKSFKGRQKVKNFIFGLIAMLSLPIALMMGCNAAAPSGPGGPTATATPGSYTTPQATPQVMVDLGTSANYVILSYAGITNSGPSTTCGGYAVYPNDLTSITGSPAIVESCGGPIDVANGAANTAQGDLGTAHTDAINRAGGAILPPGGNIGGQTLTPGLYFESGNLNITGSDLTLDGQGNSNAVFIFQIHGNMIVGPGRKITLINNANAANIFWVTTGYAALDTTVEFKGNIMAHTAVTLNTGAVLEGRALAQIENVTLLSNTLTAP